jgi:hypothetical protein
MNPIRINHGVTTTFEQQSEKIRELASWMNNLPKTIDHFNWKLNMATAFEKQASIYCESIFYQLRAKYFAEPAPIALLKAFNVANN